MGLGECLNFPIHGILFSLFRPQDSRFVDSIIYLSPIAGIDGEPGQPAYISCQAVLVGLQKTITGKLFHQHLSRGNAIAPGMTETGMIKHGGDVKNDYLTMCVTEKAEYPNGIPCVAFVFDIRFYYLSYVLSQVIRVGGGTRTWRILLKVINSIIPFVLLKKWLDGCESKR